MYIFAGKGNDQEKNIEMVNKKFVNSEYIGKYIDIESQRIHYIEQGEGEPLILIHSIGQSLYTWRLVYETLSQFYHVYAIDLIGHGYSSKPQGEYLVSDHSAIIAHFMDAFEISAAHFMAFSLGCIYTLDFCRKFPERVGRLALISPVGITNHMPAFIKRLDSRMFGWLYALSMSERAVYSLLEYNFFDLTLITNDDVREYYLPLADNNAKRAVLQCVQSFDDEEVVRSLRDINHEVLILWGNDDRCREETLDDLLPQALKHSKIEYIRNCGHTIQEEKPEKLLEYSLEFLQKGII